MFKKLLETKAKVIEFQSQILQTQIKKYNAYEIRTCIRAMKQELREIEKLVSDEELKLESN